MADLQMTIQTIAISLPTEIISNILARLPVKDVTRFKTVSKPWHTLISSLHFSHLHFHHHQHLNSQDRIVVFVGKDGCLYFSDLDISNSFNPTTINFSGYFFKDIVGSCNGLLLCTYVVNVDCVGLVLVNPSTFQHKLIPTIKEGTSVYEFGYDFKADDYKIVRILEMKIENGMPKRWEVEVYSFKSDSWKILGQQFSGVLVISRRGVLINKYMLHWLAYGLRNRVIWSFDVCTEQWSQLPLATSILRSLVMNIHVFDGRLCLMTRQLSDVFLMDVYGVKDSWVKLFECSDDIDNGSGFSYPLFYSNSRSEILVVVGRKLFWYNTTQKIFREVQSHNVLPCYAQLRVCTRSLSHLPGFVEIC